MSDWGWFHGRVCQLANCLRGKYILSILKLFISYIKIYAYYLHIVWFRRKQESNEDKKLLEMLIFSYLVYHRKVKEKKILGRVPPPNFSSPYQRKLFGSCEYRNVPKFAPFCLVLNQALCSNLNTKYQIKSSSLSTWWCAVWPKWTSSDETWLT